MPEATARRATPGLGIVPAVQHELHAPLRVLADGDRPYEELLRVVSHELRTPVAAAGMHLRALERLGDALPADGAHAVHAIRDSLDWMQRLLQDMTDAASLEGGRLRLVRRPLDLVVLLAQATELLEPLARDAGLTLALALPDALPTVVADGDRLLQVVANLVGNAIKFTPAGGTVLLEAAECAGEVRVTVRDTGRGIAPGDLPHVFERFWRAAESAGVRGAGLGLTIARGIVQQHGGRIWVESTPGRGTACHFTVPV